MVMDAKLVQLLKASSSIPVTDDGMVIEANLEQLENRAAGITGIEDERVTDIKPVQFTKALFAMVVTDDGMVIESKLVQL